MIGYSFLVIKNSRKLHFGKSSCKLLSVN